VLSLSGEKEQEEQELCSFAFFLLRFLKLVRSEKEEPSTLLAFIFFASKREMSCARKK